MPKHSSSNPVDNEVVDNADSESQEGLEDLILFEGFCLRFEDITSSKLEPPPCKRRKIEYDHSVCISPREFHWASGEGNLESRKPNKEQDAEEVNLVEENVQEPKTNLEQSVAEIQTELDLPEDEEELEVIDTSINPYFQRGPSTSVAVQFDLVKFINSESVSNNQLDFENSNQLFITTHFQDLDSRTKNVVGFIDETFSEETDTDTLRSISVIRSAEYFDVTSDFASFRCSHLVDFATQDLSLRNNNEDISDWELCKVSSLEEDKDLDDEGFYIKELRIDEKDGKEEPDENINHEEMQLNYVEDEEDCGDIDDMSSETVFILEQENDPKIDDDTSPEEFCHYYLENKIFKHLESLEDSNIQLEKKTLKNCESQTEDLEPSELEELDSRIEVDSLENAQTNNLSNNSYLTCSQHTFLEQDPSLPTPRTYEIPPKKLCLRSQSISGSEPKSDRKEPPDILESPVCLTTNWAFLPGTALDDTFQFPSLDCENSEHELEEPDDHSTNVSSPIKTEPLKVFTHKSVSDTCLLHVSITIGTNTLTAGPSTENYQNLSVKDNSKDNKIDNNVDDDHKLDKDAKASTSDDSEFTKCCSFSSLSHVTTIPTPLSSLPSLSSSLHEEEIQSLTPKSSTSIPSSKSTKSSKKEENTNAEMDKTDNDTDKDIENENLKEATTSKTFTALPELQPKISLNNISPRCSFVSPSRTTFRKSILCNASEMLEPIDENTSSKRSTYGEICEICQDSDKTSAILTLSNTSIQIPELLEMDTNTPIKSRNSYTVATLLTSVKKALKKCIPTGQVNPICEDISNNNQDEMASLSNCPFKDVESKRSKSKSRSTSNRESKDLTYFPSEEVVKTINYSDYFLKTQQESNNFLEDVVDSMGKLLEPLKHSIEEEIEAAENYEKKKIKKKSTFKKNKVKVEGKMEESGPSKSETTKSQELRILDPEDPDSKISKKEIDFDGCRYLTPSKKDVRKSEQECGYMFCQNDTTDNEYYHNQKYRNRSVSEDDIENIFVASSEESCTKKEKFKFKQILRSSERSPRKKWFQGSKKNKEKGSKKSCDKTTKQESQRKSNKKQLVRFSEREFEEEQLRMLSNKSGLFSRHNLEISPRKQTNISFEFFNVEAEIEKEYLAKKKTEEKVEVGAGEGTKQKCDCSSQNDIQISPEHPEHDEVEVTPRNKLKCCTWKFWNRILFNPKRTFYL